MSIERIFAQLHDWTTWPAPPERQRLPASAADQRPAVLIPVPIEELKPWTPAPFKVDEG